MKAGIVAVLSWFVGTILLMPSMVVKPICDLERKLEKIPKFVRRSWWFLGGLFG